jgi:hypothetical protein
MAADAGGHGRRFERRIGSAHLGVVGVECAAPGQVLVSGKVPREHDATLVGRRR